MPFSNSVRRAAAIIVFCVFGAEPAAALTYTVSNTNDSGDGSLRKAILDANNHAGADTIWFIIPAMNKTITPATALPDINEQVLLDGWVQTGFSHDPLIRIDGGIAGTNNAGLRIFAGATTVRGLIFTRWDTGVFVQSSDVTFRGNWFGTDGSASALGNQTGLRVYAGSNIKFGGTGDDDPNVISGNTSYGVYVDPVVDGLVFENNRIGTNPAGSAAQPNGSIGLRIFASNVTIGGTTAAQRNVISGNGTVGVLIEQEANGVDVYGNYIGTDLTGAFAIANGTSGVATYGTSIAIGGTVAGTGNLISGNGGDGIYVGDGTGLAIRRNYIGTNASGMAPIGNGGYALRAYGAPGAAIGSPGNGNVMSGNARGVYLGDLASGYFVRGNLIGTNKDGTVAMGNNEYGIQLNTPDNVVGGTTLGAFNVIAASPYYGVFLRGAAATNNRIEGNYIGTNTALAAGLGNGFGIGLYGANGNSIGGTIAGTGNYIRSNVNFGIYNWYGSQNRFLQNRIWENGGSGIESDPRGPQPNDALDIDHGPNEGQNFPTVTLAAAGANSVTVAGFLDSLPSMQFRVEYFVSPDCNGGGFGEGQYYVGFQNVTSGADGKATLGTVLTTNQTTGFVTATATDADGNTSEFGPCAGIGPPSAGEFNIEAPVLAYEDDGLVEVQITRTLGFSGTVSVRVKTGDDSATAPADYGAVDQIVTFADGESVKKIYIPIVLDADNAEGVEHFNVDLSEATGGAFLGSQASVSAYLYDHDPEYPAYYVGDIGVAPPAVGQKIVNVPIRLSAPTGHVITIDFTTDDGSAIAGQDYVTASGQVAFQPGDTLKLAPVTITALGPLAADRVFYMRISGGGGQHVIAADGVGEVVIFGGDLIFRNGFN